MQEQPSLRSKTVPKGRKGPLTQKDLGTIHTLIMVNKKDHNKEKEEDDENEPKDSQSIFLRQKKEILGDLMIAGLRPSKFIFAKEEDQKEI